MQSVILTLSDILHVIKLSFLCHIIFREVMGHDHLCSELGVQELDKEINEKDDNIYIPGPL